MDSNKKINISVSKKIFKKISVDKNQFIYKLLVIVTVFLSLISWLYFYNNHLSLAYNDAMSHLDIARRVFDNVTPGFAQLGSVWLPLPHILMLPTVWNDFFWKSGLSGAVVSMTSYIITVLVTYKTIRLLGWSKKSGFLSSLIVALNPNFLYLQTTALTEPLLIALFSLCCYFTISWVHTQKLSSLLLSAFFVFLATLTRYDGWFIFLFASLLVFGYSFIKDGFKKAESNLIVFASLAGFGILLWLIYNFAIFGDPFYFAFSEFSAKSQQDRMAASGMLATKGNLYWSTMTYYYSMVGNLGFFTFIFGSIGWILYILKEQKFESRLIGLFFLAPMIFNIVALYLGHSVIFLPETVGNSWFNVRYGIVVLPWAALFIAYLLNKANFIITVLIFSFILGQSVALFSSNNVITIIDGKVGASQKDVRGLGQAIRNHIPDSEKNLVLVSVASHDAIIFSTNFPMNRFIHEGAGAIWQGSLKYPDRYVNYIIMRSDDSSDTVSREMKNVPNFQDNYEMIFDGDFADLYRRKIPN